MSAINPNKFEEDWYVPPPEDIVEYKRLDAKRLESEVKATNIFKLFIQPMITAAIVTNVPSLSMGIACNAMVGLLEKSVIRCTTSFF